MNIIIVPNSYIYVFLIKNKKCIDINSFRKTIKASYSTGIAATSTPSRANGILVLPILWRQDLKFGVAGYDDETIEADLGLLGVDDGIPTLDDLTLEGIPNIRSVVSDVLMDSK